MSRIVLFGVSEIVYKTLIHLFMFSFYSFFTDTDAVTIEYI